MKVFLANCSAHTPHTGCLATTDSLVRGLLVRGCELFQVFFTGQLNAYWQGDRERSVEGILASPLGGQLGACDAVIVNGEGTIHHGRGNDLLALLCAAQQLGKHTLLINSVIQDVAGFDDVLRSLDDFTVRDKCSADYLEQKGIPCRLVADLILEAGFAERGDVPIKGQIICTDWHPQRDRDVGTAIWDFCQATPACWFYPLHHSFEVFRWQHSVPNFRQASLVVTGRHHGVYLAGMAGVPFVCFPSNTHKVEGLAKYAGLPLPICRTGQELEGAIRYARRNPALARDFADFLLQQRPLTALDFVGTPRYRVEDVEDKVGEFFDDVRAHHTSNQWLVNPFATRFFKSRRMRARIARIAKSCMPFCRK